MRRMSEEAFNMTFLTAWGALLLGLLWVGHTFAGPAGEWETVAESDVVDAALSAQVRGWWGRGPVRVQVWREHGDDHPREGDVHVPVGGSLAEAYAQLEPGGRLLLERGGVWTEPIPRLNISGVTITAYGDGPRPIIEALFPVRSALGAEPLHDIAIIGLHLRAPDGWDGQSGDAVGVWIQRTGSNLLIEDCLIEGFANNVSIEGMEANGFRGFTLRNSVLLDPYRIDSGNTNLFVSSVNGLLIEGNALINTMANEARGVKHSHGMYLSASNTPGTAVVRGNLIYNARTNITLRGGGVVEGNLSIRGGQGITSSPSDLGPASVTIRGNVVAESRNHWNGQLLGLGIEARDIRADIEDNIVFGATDGSSHVGITLSGAGGAVRGNTVYAWSREGEGLLSPALVVNAAAPIAVEGNRLVQTRNQFVVWDRTLPVGGDLVSYAGNAYHTPRGKQFYIDEDRRGWTFEQRNESGASWFEAAPESWPVSLAEALGVDVEAWIAERVRAWDAGVVGEAIRRLSGEFQ